MGLVPEDDWWQYLKIINCIWTQEWLWQRGRSKGKEVQIICTNWKNSICC